ncbi:MAG: DUF1573 domain-containing protein [Zavarzinella sp.]
MTILPRAGFFLLLFCVGCGPATNSVSESPAVDSASPAPEVVLLSHAQCKRFVGYLPANTQRQLDDEIRVRNDTTEPIVLVKANRSCTCSVVDFQPVTVAPGEEISIKTRTSLPARSGPWNYSVSLVRADKMECQIVSHAYIYQPFEADQQSLNFSDLKKGETRDVAAKFILHRLASEPAQMPQFRVANQHAKILSSSSQQEKVGPLVREVHTVTLALTAGEERSTYQDTVIAKLPHLDLEVMQLVTWGRETTFQLSPARAFFSISKQQQQPQKVVVLISSKSPMKLQLPTQTELPSGVQVQITPSGETKALVTVTVDPTRLKDKSLREEVLLTTDVATEPQLPLPITIFLPESLVSSPTGE